MAKLEFSYRLRTIHIIGDEVGGEKYYNSWWEEDWNTAKAILKEFNITLYDFHVLFDDDAYKMVINSKNIFEESAIIYFNDSIVAKGSVDGSNCCDSGGKLVVYIDALRSAYEAKLVNIPYD